MRRTSEPVAKEVDGGAETRWTTHEGERLTTKFHESRTGYFTKLATQPRLVSLIPSDERGFRRVFRGQDYRPVRGRQLTRFRGRVKDAGGEIRDTTQFDFRAFKELLKNHDRNHPLVLIAHSEGDGRRVVLPNGSPVEMEEINAACGARRINCLVLTCHSETFTTGEPITAEEALAMWKAGRERAAEGEVPTMEEFVDTMRRARLRMKWRRRLAIGGLVTSSAAGPRYAVDFFVTEDEG